jgi:hypothetical protein
MNLLPNGAAKVSGKKRGLRIIDEGWAQTDWTLARASAAGRSFTPVDIL